MWEYLTKRESRNLSITCLESFWIPCFATLRFPNMGQAGMLSLHQRGAPLHLPD